MGMYIAERLVVDTILGDSEFEVFLNSNNEIYIGDDYSAFTLNKEDWQRFKEFVDGKFESMEELQNEQ